LVVKEFQRGCGDNVRRFDVASNLWPTAGKTPDIRPESTRELV
jgi:hypothetical protein